MSIRNYIQQIVGEGAATSFIAVVTSVNEGSVDVDPINGDSPVYDVRLQATEDKAGVYIVPEKGSYVIVTMIDELHGFVTGMSDIEYMSMKIKSIDIAKKIDELCDILNSVSDVISNIKVVTPTGPSTALLPDSMTSLVRLNSDIAAFKGDLNSIIKPM